MTKTLLILLLHLIVLSKVFCQTSQETTFESNKLVIKFKSSFINNKNFRNGSLTSKELQKSLNEAGVINVKSFVSSKKKQKLKSRSLRKNKPTKKVAFLDQLYIVETTPEKDLNGIISILNKNEAVEYAEPIYKNELLGDLEPMFLPNDTHINQIWGLQVTQTLDAWDVTQGNEEVVIAIVDEGFNVNHPDLVNQWAYNEAELNGVEGIDDDNNGYIDDFLGYDFLDYDNIVNRANGDEDHATGVAGTTGAEVNNAFGGAGVGYRCKLLPVRSLGFQGIIYAVEQGAKIINCSWGRRDSFSRWEEEIVEYLTNEYGVLIIAAAGNFHNALRYLYPASYQKVLSVGMTDINDMKWGVNNSLIDILGPGVNTVFIKPSGEDLLVGGAFGTSYSAPFIAGAAGLVAAAHPDLTGWQIGQVLKATCDDVSGAAGNEAIPNFLGAGRVNVLNAVNYENNLSRIDLERFDFTSETGKNLTPNNPVQIVCEFKNYLQSSSENCQIILSSSSQHVEIQQNIFDIGQVNTLELATNENQPFIFTLNEGTPLEEEVEFQLTFNDGDLSYKEFFFLRPQDIFSFELRNNFTVGLTSDGRIGQKDLFLFDANGDGFVDFNLQGVNRVHNLEAETNYIGLVIAQNESKVSDAIVASIDGGDHVLNNDFTPLQQNKYYNDSYHNKLEDYSNNDNAIGLEIDQKIIFYNDVNKFFDQFVLHYEVKNITPQTIENLHLGLFSDWNLSNQDFTGWNDEHQFGYVYNSLMNEYVGIRVINSNPIYTPMDMDVTYDIPGDGFSDAEKFDALSNGISDQAFENKDVAHIVGTTVENLQPGETRSICFVVGYGNSLELLADRLTVSLFTTEENNSVRPTFNETIIPSLLSYDIKVALEGLPTQLEDGYLSTLQNTIPLQQPFNQAPWFYSGNEAVDELPNENIVDWVLLETRQPNTLLPQHATKFTSIARKAGFLLKSGKVVDIDGQSFIQMPSKNTYGSFIVTHHRNHLPILSSTLVNPSNGIINYDFTTNANQAFGQNSLKQLSDGRWAMIAGDANQDGLINELDREIWNDENGRKASYPSLKTDFNFDGRVNALDRNKFWKTNKELNFQSQLPD